MVNADLNFFLDLIKKEILRKKGVNWATLSTLNEGRPESRTVVLRTLKTINDEILIRIYTHALSAKAEQIQKNANIQLCWYFPRKKVQIQFAGTGLIKDDDESKKIFNSLPEHSRKDYQGNKPGTSFEVLNSSEFHFSILEVSVEKCVVLHLQRDEPHLKIMASKDSHWSSTRMHP